MGVIAVGLYFLGGMDIWWDTMLAGDGHCGCCTMDEALSPFFLIRNRVVICVSVCRFCRFFWFGRAIDPAHQSMIMDYFFLLALVCLCDLLS